MNYIIDTVINFFIVEPVISFTQYTEPVLQVIKNYNNTLVNTFYKPYSTNCTTCYTPHILRREYFPHLDLWYYEFLYRYEKYGMEHLFSDDLQNLFIHHQNTLYADMPYNNMPYNNLQWLKLRGAYTDLIYGPSAPYLEIPGDKVKLDKLVYFKVVPEEVILTNHSPVTWTIAACTWLCTIYCLKACIE